MSASPHSPSSRASASSWIWPAWHFCDSSGITALIAARNRAQDAHAAVALAAVPASTLRILRVAGLDLVFPLYTDSEAATRP